jgi:YgiT-type zinc finger domain-containing protein
MGLLDGVFVFLALVFRFPVFGVGEGEGSEVRDIRCPECSRKMGEMGADVAILEQGGRTIVVREIISIQCDKCRNVWIPRMPKAQVFDVAANVPRDETSASDSVVLADVLSSDTVMESVR